MVEINNLTTVSVDEEFVKGVAKKVLKGENRKEIDLSIVFVGEARMRKLNKKYRGKNKVTDVLSFGQGLNEIVVCLREIKKNAKIYTPLEITGTEKKHKEKESLTGYNSTFKRELARVLIHAILHLSGYDHKKMQNKEEYYAKAIHY